MPDKKQPAIAKEDFSDKEIFCIARHMQRYAEVFIHEDPDFPDPCTLCPQSTIIAEGVGEASSYESKYRYRWVYESDVPKGLDKESLVNRIFKNKKTGAEYAKYRIENSDLIDQWNTILKMAKKRALVYDLADTRFEDVLMQQEAILTTEAVGRI